MNKQDNKNMFLNNFDFMVKSPYPQYLSWNISKIFYLSKCPKPIIDLYGISFFCNNFETFTIFSDRLHISAVLYSFCEIKHFLKQARVYEFIFRSYFWKNVTC